ncbi:MAG: nitrate reductase [Magnetococcales bacterium]|nr:nitrate reductase [Magnetococcales bacterium]
MKSINHQTVTPSLLLLLLFLGLFLTCSVAFSSPQPKSEPPNTDSYCLRCHGMKTLSYQDPQTGNLVDLSIDETALPHATHGKQPCESCHKGDFDDYPHDIAHEKQATSCPDCHQDKPELKKYRFDKIAIQFNKSVHYQKDPEHFTCYTCHDLHTWQIGQSHEATDKLVAGSNGICLGCHTKNSQEPMPTPSITESHDWLPSSGLHLQSIRCVECHTPRPGSIVHAIEPARRAEKECESCHTQDSILLTKLYKYRLGESERKAGFINGVVLNDSYIIGMTRHPILDLLGILMVLFTALGVGAHGLGRWLAARRRRDHDKR